MKKCAYQDRSQDPTLDPVQCKPLEVVVENNDVETAIRSLKRAMQKEQIVAEFKERQRYEKPSDKKRRKFSESQRKKIKMETLMRKIESGEYEKEKIKKLAKKEEKRKLKTAE
jgi:small subunit ribosomal protein S21